MSQLEKLKGSFMRQSAEVKAETHELIVKQAAQLFRERGIERTSVADVMKASNRTHGGFYRHFENKNDLLITALRAAFTAMTDLMKDRFSKTPIAAARLSGFKEYYLSSKHFSSIGSGCPVAALSGDMARESDDLKSEFGRGIRSIIAKLSDAMEETDKADRDLAIRIFAQQLGALMMARASDPETAELVLAACRDTGNIHES
jgi:TetR/AcrR family transcriptional repressor of nem operon